MKKLILMAMVIGLLVPAITQGVVDDDQMMVAQSGLVLCCCQTDRGGMCCAYVSYCDSSWIPGCDCK